MLSCHMREYRDHSVTYFSLFYILYSMNIKTYHKHSPARRPHKTCHWCGAPISISLHKEYAFHNCNQLSAACNLKQNRQWLYSQRNWHGCIPYSVSTHIWFQNLNAANIVCAFMPFMLICPQKMLGQLTLKGQHNASFKTHDGGATLIYKGVFIAFSFYPKTKLPVLNAHC